MPRFPYARSYDDTPVLVTGGAGFVGSHLARRLAELGARVRVVDDLSTGHAENLADVDATLFEASVLDPAVLAEAIDGCKVVFHLAAMVSVPLSVEDPEQCVAVNIRGTHDVLQAARAAEIDRVVFASSAAVYGDDPNLPSRESDPVDCRSPYAASKAAGEAMIEAFGSCYPLSTVSLRYFNVFGPRQDPDSPYAAAIAAFLKTLADGRSPTVFGDGEQTRDFISVENVVHANLLAGVSPRELRGETLNIGAGGCRTLLDVIRRMAEILGVDGTPEFAPPRAGDVRHSVADVSRAREMLGYEPIVDFDEGLARLVAAELRPPR